MTIGIYALRNKITKKYYVGSSKHIETRRDQHLYQLRRGCHHSIKLQRSYDRHGEQAFEFLILKSLDDKSSLLEIEEEFIELYQAWSNGYNIRKKGISREFQPETQPRILNAPVTLKDRLLQSGSIKIAQEQIKATRGTDISYKTLLYWVKGRIDIEGYERLVALKEFLRLDDKEFIQLLKNTKESINKS